MGEQTTNRKDRNMTTKTTHTPGPYRIGEYFMAGKPREEIWIHSEGRTCPVCMIPSHNRREQAENDADLIAAAPELLEALKNAAIALRFYAARMLENSNKEEQTYPFGQYCENKARLISAKAEGQTP
ncbi:MAG: hypothetical protein WC347_06095 [Smithellaceae bacterium]